MGLARYAKNVRAAQDRECRFTRPVRRLRARPGSARMPCSAKDRVRSDRTRRRLREMVRRFSTEVEPRFGTALMAYAWYRSEPLSGFSGQTAMQLVRAGRVDEVLDYIDAVDAGVYA